MSSLDIKQFLNIEQPTTRKQHYRKEITEKEKESKEKESEQKIRYRNRNVIRRQKTATTIESRDFEQEVTSQNISNYDLITTTEKKVLENRYYYD